MKTIYRKIGRRSWETEKHFINRAYLMMNRLIKKHIGHEIQLNLKREHHDEKIGTISLKSKIK